MTSSWLRSHGLASWVILSLLAAGCSDDPAPAADDAADTPATDVGSPDAPDVDASVPGDTGAPGDSAPPGDTPPTDTPPPLDAGTLCPSLTPTDGTPCTPPALQPCEYPGVVCGPGMRHFNTATCTNGRWVVVIAQCPPTDAGPPTDFGGASDT